MKMFGVGILIVAVFVFAFLHSEKFGRLPHGEELKRIEKSPNYKNGRFQNLEPTRKMTGEGGFFTVMADYFFGKHPNTKPVQKIPSVKTDLRNPDENEDFLIWFGHSSYFIQAGGVRFLIDLVFSETASPVPFNVVAFDGADIYGADDMPAVDYVIITHDHWDHLDYPTMKALKDKAGKIVTGLGVGSHLRRWGFKDERIAELDWFDTFSENGVEIHCLPARHFSGRGLSENKTLWSSFLLKFPDFKLYAGGDSGYGKHYEAIGRRFGGIDLALLDSGQYDKNWREIHETPEQVVQAAHDLKTAALFAGHNSKFTISNHPWNEPMERVSSVAEKEEIRLLTPKIGEKVFLKKSGQTFEKWW